MQKAIHDILQIAYVKIIIPAFHLSGKRFRKFSPIFWASIPEKCNQVIAIELFSIVEEYDPIIDTWAKKTDMPTARAGTSSVVINGRIYVIGGANIMSAAVPTVEEYTPEGWPFSQSISPEDKQPTKWGQEKRRGQ